jgi:hypothetical protein
MQVFSIYYTAKAQCPGGQQYIEDSQLVLTDEPHTCVALILGYQGVELYIKCCWHDAIYEDCTY